MSIEWGLFFIATSLFVISKVASLRGSSWTQEVSVLFWVLLSVLIVRSFFWEPMKTEGPSMEPTFKKQSIVFLNKQAYGWVLPLWDVQNWSRHAKQKDVVAFRLKEETYVKRVWARWGDVVEMRYPQGWYVNGLFVAPPSRHPFSWMVHGGFIESSYQKSSSSTEIKQQMDKEHRFSIRVPYGYIFVIGDNPSHSKDSRDFGFVSMTDVLGRVEKPRWGNDEKK